MAKSKKFWESKSFWFGTAELIGGLAMFFTYDKPVGAVLVGLGLSTLGIRDAQQVKNLFRVK